MKDFIKSIELVENLQCYHLADVMLDVLIRKSFVNLKNIRTAAWPYEMTAIDELPISARQVPWEKNKEDYDQYDDVFWQELKQRIPDYKALPVDKDEETNLESAMHGPDGVPGPAFVWPEGNNTSPSMTGSLNDFTWDQARDVNEGTEYWKNLLPRH